MLSSFLSRRPASRVLRSTARQQWKLLTLNVGTSLAEALTEGATLGVIFLALELLSATDGGPGPNLSRYPSIGILGSVAEAFAQAPRAPLFLGLLGVAVLLQALMTLGAISTSSALVASPPAAS